ncbi:LytR/AlgR family response regulator transcription factor [Sphingomonas pokkalii]|uniref:Response regulatory domain-containing protein n=1 Tax=Sphingomonas pokkalii TaxID=2175090 RepID=A0A2U0SCR2_9SPHN|nr:response regulator [Sphingomonas pokkalii]PVX29166.1 hypothetical protein DD559_07335 [Sphingomonas pokkalii]
MIRTLIVDDEPLARRAIRAPLGSQPDFTVIGEAGHGAAAIAAIEALRPDLVFLDVQMPEMTGFDVIEAVGVDAMPLIVFVTAFDAYALRAFEEQALDYLLKPFDDLRFGMREILRQGRYARGIILLSLDLDRQDLDELQAEAGSTIQIWSLARLDELTSGDAILAERLELLALDTAMEWSPVSPLIQPQPTPRQDSFSPIRVPQQMPVTAAAIAPPLPPGAAIAARLRGTAPGHAGWQAYEAGCIDAVRFLFGKELHQPTRQKRSADGHHRKDLICRIRSEPSSFWSMIESDFSTRYVVFEAKNSAEAVGQNEVELTAKYLFAKGLRTVAILFARAGSSDSARIAAEQTLRDRGTLVLILSLTDLCGMLEGADAGDPPQNFMFEKVDEFLMSLGR